jgi:hypothetical protein
MLVVGRSGQWKEGEGGSYVGCQPQEDFNPMPKPKLQWYAQEILQARALTPPTPLFKQLVPAVGDKLVWKGVLDPSDEQEQARRQETTVGGLGRCSRGRCKLHCCNLQFGCPRWFSVIRTFVIFGLLYFLYLCMFLIFVCKAFIFFVFFVICMFCNFQFWCPRWFGVICMFVLSILFVICIFVIFSLGVRIGLV